jgi:hypothetical protein
MRAERLVVLATLASWFVGMATLGAPSSVWAADNSGFNIQISPLPIITSVDPGKVTTNDLRVRNAGTTDDAYEIHIVKVTEDDNGTVHLSPPGPTDEFVHWIKFSQTTFPAPAGKWVDIKMTISPPKSAAFGYYFAVEYSRANPEKPSGGQAAANGAAATFVLLDVNAPGEARQAQIVSFTADRKWYQFLPANFSVKVHADGNVQVIPYGNIFIQSGGQTIATLNVNDTQGNVLPQSSRIFTSTWNDGFPNYVTKTVNGQPQLDKNNKPIRTLTWNWSKIGSLRFGQYTASLIMTYDNGHGRDVPVSATLTFWVIPWGIIFVVLLVILLILAGIFSAFRSAWQGAKNIRRR